MSVKRLIGLKPLPGFLVVIGSLVLAGWIGSLLPPRVGFGAMNATASVLEGHAVGGEIVPARIESHGSHSSGRIRGTPSGFL